MTSERTPFLEQARDQLLDFERRIDALRAEVAGSTEKAHQDVKAEITDLERRTAMVRAELEKAGNRAIEAGNDFQGRVTAAWSEIDDGLRKAAQRLAD